MKAKTREYKAEAQNDFDRIRSHKAEKTANPAQSAHDFRAHYISKWERLRKEADTKAQREWCDYVLRNFDNVRNEK